MWVRSEEGTLPVLVMPAYLERLRELQSLLEGKGEQRRPGSVRYFRAAFAPEKRPDATEKRNDPKDEQHDILRSGNEAAVRGLRQRPRKKVVEEVEKKVVEDIEEQEKRGNHTEAERY